jgi:hypothetical protein
MHCPLQLSANGHAQFDQIPRFLVQRTLLVDRRAQLIVSLPNFLVLVGKIAVGFG